MRFIFSAIAVCFLATGCATRYNEPPSSSDNASVQAIAPVWIASVDGGKVSRLSFSGKKELAVSPGRHVLELQYAGHEDRDFENSRGERRTFTVGVASRRNVFVPFVAEPQKIYYVHAGVALRFWRPYIDQNPPHGFLNLSAQ